MAESSSRTLVCSVAFLDLVGHSKKSIAEQVSAKQSFNEILTHALREVPPRDFIVLDTGDGVAIAFLGDPENALYATAAMRDSVERHPDTDLAVRLGINLGPVRLVWDLNSQLNILGDGINVAQRVMDFAEPGQLLVSRSFSEAVTSLTPELGPAFKKLASRKDKHVREHDLYEVGDVATAPRPRPKSEEPERRRQPRDHRPGKVVPAQVFDAGPNLIVSGASREAVDAMLKMLAAEGHKVLSPPAQVGAKWIASAEHPNARPEACKVEKAGFKRIVSGPTREAVTNKVAELVSFGAVLVSTIEMEDGVWTAVCDEAGSR